ncbi:YibE/F family protein [Spongisporangium articulatum]|uniref:YibE/F family protein n=1 Tax=Spongisporangium articulatum TaxID=3362603 RepID=A0ABW8ANG8_9ACTN
MTNEHRRHRADTEAIGVGHLPDHLSGALSSARGQYGDNDAQAELQVPQQLKYVLSGIVAAIAFVAVVAMALMWPSHEAVQQTVPTDAYQGVTFHSATVTAVETKPCSALSEDDPDATGGGDAQANCVTATVDLKDEAGKPVTINVPTQESKAGLGVGDSIRLSLYPAADGEPAVYAWTGYDRSRTLLILGLIFVAVVVAVARLRGLAVLAGLAITFALLIYFVLPALRLDGNGFVVGLVAGTVMVTALLYLAHGFSTRTTVAWLGTFSGLVLTAMLAWIVTSWAHMNGLTTEDDYVLGRLTTGGGLTGIILCGMVVAAVGVLNDVTIAQVAAVWELHAVAPGLSASGLFGRALRIGRDNMASTFYTLIFAYLGAALPTLLLIDLYRQPFSEVLANGEVAEQIARVIVGGIGLVLTIPLTTAIAAVVAATATPVHAAGVSAETMLIRRVP